MENIVTRDPKRQTAQHTPTARTREQFSRRDRFLISVPAGIFLFLLLRLSDYLLSPVQEIFLVIASAGISILVYVVSKDYLSCAISQSLGLLFTLIYLLTDADKAGVSIANRFTFQDSFHIGLIWASGLLFTVMLRLFSIEKWDTRKRRGSFLRAFHLSSVVFLMAYAGLLVLLFYFQRSIDPDGERSLNLIPLAGAFEVYWPHILAGEFGQGIFIQFFGNLLIFTPLGFYVNVYFKKMPAYAIILLPILLSGVIEATQYIFNMGKSDIDDFWMNVLGYWIGFFLYKLLGWIRRLITRGEEKNIC
jgi:glycopeptide antibiotics resistance protein